MYSQTVKKLPRMSAGWVAKTASGCHHLGVITYTGFACGYHLVVAGSANLDELNCGC